MNDEIKKKNKNRINDITVFTKLLHLITKAMMYKNSHTKNTQYKSVSKVNITFKYIKLYLQTLEHYLLTLS